MVSDDWEYEQDRRALRRYLGWAEPPEYDLLPNWLLVVITMLLGFWVVGISALVVVL